MAQGSPFLFPIHTKEIEAILGALREGRRLIQIHGPSGSGKSELLPLIARTLSTRNPVLAEMRTPLVPNLSGALLDRIDPGGVGRQLLAEDASALDFFLRHMSALLLIDHTEVCRAQVAEQIPLVLEKAPRCAAIVVCQEPFPWSGAVSVGLTSTAVPDDSSDPRWELLLEFCPPDRRAAWLADRKLGRLWLRLGGLPRSLRLAAPALAALGIEETLQRLEGRLDPEALPALAWSFLSEAEQDALGLLAAFSGGCTAGAFASCGRDINLLLRLARSGWLRRLNTQGEPRWSLSASALTWISSQAFFAMHSERYCVEHMQCTVQRRMMLDRRQALGTEQRNFWINVLRLEDSPLFIRENAYLVAWLLDGLLCSHGSLGLLPDHCDRADSLVDRLEHSNSFHELGEIAPVLLLHRAEMLLVNGYRERALAHLAPLEGLPLVGLQATLHRLRLLLDVADDAVATSTIIPTLVRLWEQHSSDPSAELSLLAQAFLMVGQLGEVELAREMLDRVLQLHARSNEPPELLLAIRFHALMMEGDLDQILQQEKALTERLLRADFMDYVVSEFLVTAAVFRGDAAAALAQLDAMRSLPIATESLSHILQFNCMEGIAALLSGQASLCRTAIGEMVRVFPRRERLARTLLFGILALCEAREGNLARSDELLVAMHECALPLRASREIASLLSAAVRLARGEPATEVSSEGRCMPTVLLARYLLTWQRNEVSRVQRTILLARDGSWWKTADGPRISVGSRPVLLALLRALCDARQARPGVPLDKETLVRSAWPAERRTDSPAATNRLHVALATLRKQGLAEALCSAREGWFLAPEQTALRDP